jgi:hypothetical protein
MFVQKSINGKDQVSLAREGAAQGRMILGCSLLFKIVGKVLDRKLDFEQARLEAKDLVSKLVVKSRALLDGSEKQAGCALPDG